MKRFMPTLAVENRPPGVSRSLDNFTHMTSVKTSHFLLRASTVPMTPRSSFFQISPKLESISIVRPRAATVPDMPVAYKYGAKAKCHPSSLVGCWGGVFALGWKGLIYVDDGSVCEL